MIKSLVLVLAAVVVPLVQGSDGKSRDDLEKQVRDLLAASDSRDAGAQARLKALVDRSYRELFELRGKTADARLRNRISLLLSIPAIKAARIVIAGKIRKLEQIQGGVVDYHKLLVHFDRRASELKPSRERSERLDEDQVFELASGTHRDTWLCDLMERDLTRLEGEHVFVLNRRALEYGFGSAGHRTAFVHFEYEVLPAAAVAAIPKILAEK